jgi:hypothetical protein
VGDDGTDMRRLQIEERATQGCNDASETRSDFGGSKPEAGNKELRQISKSIAENECLWSRSGYPLFSSSRELCKSGGDCLVAEIQLNQQSPRSCIPNHVRTNLDVISNLRFQLGIMWRRLDHHVQHTRVRVKQELSSHVGTSRDISEGTARFWGAGSRGGRRDRIEHLKRPADEIPHD